MSRPKTWRCRNACGNRTSRRVDGEPLRICDDCLARTLADWNDHSSSAGWETRLRAKYGITVDEHAWMFLHQRGLCAICKDPERSSRTAEGGTGLVVDHDHVTGEVRGLLCSRCNAGIGLLGDRVDWTHSAMWYLRFHKPEDGRRDRDLAKQDRTNAHIEKRKFERATRRSTSA